MHISKEQLPLVLESVQAISRQIEWGGTIVARETFAAGTDPTPLFRGLPDNRCQCPHWGYMVQGRMRVQYADHEEIIQAGEVYYLAPGHLVNFEEETELIEFSPRDQYQQTIEVIGQNLAAMQAQP